MEPIRYTEKQFKTLSRIKEVTINACKYCNGEGFIKNIGECNCRKVFRWCSALTRANIPRAYWGLDIEELKVPAVICNVVIEYMNNFENVLEEGLGFIFSGEWGIGKTSLMCEIGKFAILQGQSVFYLLVDDYVKSKMDVSRLNTTKPIEDFDMLLLDELDKVYMKSGSDYSIKETEKLFRNSLPFGKLVIVGTNATEEEVMSIFGKSLLSVVKRHLNFIEFEGKDHSDKLQDAWVQRLKKNRGNYVTGNILKYAKVYCKKFIED